MTHLPVSRVPDPQDAPPVRWGILGTGLIAGAFAYAVRSGTSGTLAVVGSRRLESAERFAAEHGVGRAVGSYPELVGSDDVDIVYVASPHSAHHEHALLALGAGKAVLVEKAFTRNAAEAAEVIETARSRNLLCQEAMWARFLPHYDLIRQLVGGGHLGTVQSVFADHGQLLWPNGPQRLSDPALAGGSLLDLGIYPVSFAQMVLGDLVDVSAVGTLTDQGVDANVAIAARGASGGLAVLNSTMAAKTPTTACIAGDAGRIEIEGDFYMPNRVRLRDPQGQVLQTWDYEVGTGHVGLKYEAAEVARRFTAGETESPLLTWADTLSIMGTLDAVRRQIGMRYPGEVPLSGR